MIQKAIAIESEVACALRFGKLSVARLQPVGRAEVTPPDDGPWKVDVIEKGRLDQFLAEPVQEGALEATHVRIAVRAAGMNFRDVLNVLGMVPVPWLGLELAGVVTEVGAGVTDLSVGDRVFGMGHATFATSAVADRRLLIPIPELMSFEEAATIPLTFLTAWYALKDLGKIKTGERILIHAAAGGVGMAAMQLAELHGLEVFGTASEPKWSMLRQLGLDDAHIGSSRDVSFADRVREATGGEGVDLVLNSLAREFIDESLPLLRAGGRFLEMGKTDIREPEAIAKDYPNISLYTALDLSDESAEHVQGLFVELGAWFIEGKLKPLPYDAYDLRDAAHAFRYMANARHIGKLVLRVPRSVNPSGTVLITGGTGELGQSVARHLITNHGVQSLILTSRRGMDAEGAPELLDSLRSQGAEYVDIVSCDVTDRASLGAVLESIPPAYPLAGVYHLAGVLDDGVLTALTDEQLTKVFAPKVDGAWNLHELTQAYDLDAFVLFSSVAGAMGGPGQGNYAAANTFVDALAAARRKAGLAGVSLAWGFWEQAGVGMTAHLGSAELARLSRQGLVAMSAEEGLGLMDEALSRSETTLLPVRFDLGRLQRMAGDASAIPPLWREMFKPRLRRASSGSQDASALRQRLSMLPEAERGDVLTEMVRAEIATVLGLAGANAIPADQPLKDLGLDSLMAVELRNRLAAMAQINIPATLAFDYPTPEAISGFMLQKAFSDLGAGVEAVASTQVIGDDETIAVVGMSCRLPGGVSDPESYWELLADGRDAISGFPERWQNADLFDPDPDAIGKTYCQEGGFLDQIDLFDASFFGIAPREAVSMDPQQRLLLEVSWEALERAGIKPFDLRGSLTGVYIGSIGSDYQLPNEDFDVLDGYQATGRAASVLSGRLSYTLGLQGPALTIDTACSSSLISLHLACNALRHGECHLALAGGSQTMVTPAIFVEMSRLRAQSVDGRCKSFSSRADGASWSEGVGMLVLKRLSDAERDGDRVLAVIKGTAVNQDGRSQGLTAPNGPSQQRVIRQALAGCGLKPNDIDLIEAHGTGTSLGDPIEAGALAEVFGPTRSEVEPLVLGSSKSNIGHAQAAAGVAGVMKVILSLMHETIPKTLHAEEPTPHIPWEESRIELAQSARGWPRRDDRVRRAGVSAFGISGTNAHVIIEEAPSREPELVLGATLQAPLPLMISGRDLDALRGQAARMKAWLEADETIELPQVAYAAACERTHFQSRALISVQDREQALDALGALADGGAHAALTNGVAQPRGEVVFVFPGQGSQWQAMGKSLLDESSVFAETIDACDAVLSPLTGWSVRTVLAGDEGQQTPSLDRVDVVQPALFAMSVGLGALWRSLGLEPKAVVGHSQGEVGAAVVAGALSLEDAARVVVVRSTLVRKIAGRGGMLVVEQPVEAVEERLSRYEGALSIAVVNTATSTVVSGDNDALEALLSELQAEDVFARKVNVDYASHSIHVDTILTELTEQLADIRPQPAEIPFYSTVTGGKLDGSALDANYWGRNLREPVRLDRALQGLLADDFGVFVEVSAHPLLGMPLTSACSDSGGVVIGTLQRDQGGLAQVYSALGALHTHGHAIDWEALLVGQRSQGLVLPTYAFQRSRYWLEATGLLADVTSAGMTSAEHPLLGATTALADSDGYLFTGRLSRREQPWLADHGVFGTTLFPGTGLLELALAATRQLGGATVSELALAAPVVLPAGEALRIQLSLEPADATGQRTLMLHSQPEEASEEMGWTHHATGVVQTEQEPTGVRCDDLVSWPPPEAEALELDGFYEELRERGFDYGPSFQGLQEAWRTPRAAYGRVSLPERLTTSANAYGLHPALLDAALHTLMAAGRDQEQTDGDGVLLPFEWADVSLFAVGATELRVRVELEYTGADATSAKLVIADGGGQLVATVGALRVRRATMQQIAAATRTDVRHLYRVDWQPALLPKEERPTSEFMVVGGQGQLAELLGVRHVPSLEDWLASRDEDETAPSCFLVDDTASRDHGELLEHLHTVTSQSLSLLQQWLGAEGLGESELIWVTRGAVSVSPDDAMDDLAHAPTWGLLRSARSENPDRIMRILDLGPEAPSRATILRALNLSDEPEAAIRYGKLLAARLGVATVGSVEPPEHGPWKLELPERGRLDRLVAEPLGAEELEAGQIRIAMRAAGINFRDVLNVLGMVPVPWLGLELAGVVSELGPEVEGLALGDRVWGMGRASFASHSVADARLVAKVPEGLSFEEAATMPLTYLTAFYALVDLGELKPGERVLIHAGAGGVGMAAIQLAQLIGAEVFATASEPKWDVLRAMGISDDHIASSRSLGFGAAFTAVTEGAGVDVVLNSLAREFVDESLDLLGEGGRFLEMGKTDLRDAAQLASTHPGLRYLPLDLSEAGVEALSGMLNKLGDYFERGELKPLTFSAYDLRDAGSAFRFMANARHVGKLVLTMPREREPQGTALLTGGTGELGQAVARHLVLHHHVRSLILTSRRGMESTGAAELVEELRELGASRVEIVACDVTDLAAVQAVVNSCPPEHPLTAVFHLAGVLDDAVLGNLTQAMLVRVLAPKVDGAWNLHRATESCQLAQFVLFSSAAGTLGGPGQGNYAAANTFLDMLAARRRKLGLAGLSLAWGFWEQAGVGMTAHLGTAELARMSRQGIVAMSVEEGLALLDASMRRPETALVPVRFDLKKMQRGVAQLPAIPAMWRNLLRQGLKKASGTSEEASQLRVRLAGLSEQGRIEALGELVRGEVAAVLGLAGAEAVPGEEPLKDLGLDSLMAVELRNRLAMQTDVTLPATVAFDYPTPNAIGEYLYKKAFEDLNRASGMTATRIQRDPDEPIAIIGMACRLPGEVEDPESYWELLRDGRDAIQDFGHRWPAELLYDPDPDAVGMTYSRHGGFMKQIDLFDAGFFGISPREANSMGPDQRILLETSWEALERAGLRPSALKDSLTGVYIGSVGSDYGQRNESFDILDGYQGTGRAGSVLSGRISYALGLQGPAMTLDTACSSSLVSMHLASTALRQGECDLALAGGVQVMVTPSIFIEMSRLRAQSPDGRCKSFSDDANGAAWAEGVGVLVLKRLSDAQRDGDRVLALIRSSAVNQDGRSNGLTAPNGPSQQRVIQQALANGGLSPNDIDYLEAHGTGTTLGDPIEAGALAEVFGPTRQSDRPLYLGSSKSNLGHSQASAGVAGVIKVILSMHAQMLPKTLHAETPSSHIAWEGSGLSLLREPQGWEKQSGRVRRAGVSGFGISGTNAHVIIEEAPTVPGEEHEINLEEAYGTGREPMPLLLSGRDDGALRDQALNWARWLEDNPSTPFFHVLHTAAVRRTHFTHRLGVMARNATEAAAGLRAFVEEGRPASIVYAEARGRAKVAYVFPGQGSQWLGMGRALLETSEIFTEVIAECDDLMTPLIDWSLLAVLRGDEGAASIERTDVLQPAHFAVTLGLAALWRSFGILPQAVVGHSQGEVGAAVVAGVLSLEDGVRLIVERSKLIRRIAGQGAMAAVSMDAPALEERLARFGGQLGIAVRNTQRSLVFSGPGEFVDELVAELQAEDIFCRRINADYAAHSIQMDALLGELTESLRELEPRAGSVPLYSSVLGERIDGSEMDSRYWCRNLRDTVRFDQAMKALVDDGYGVFIEASAHPVLLMPLTSASGESGLVVGSLERDRGGLEQLYRNLAQLHCSGVEVHWESLLDASGTQHAPLPPYPFQRERHWLEPIAAVADVAAAGLTVSNHPLLGAMTPLADRDSYLFTGRLSMREEPWLRDHVIFDTALLPGTGIVEIIMSAARNLGSATIDSLNLAAPLVLDDTVGVQLQLSVEPPNDRGLRAVTLHSRLEDAPEGTLWDEHALAMLSGEPLPDASRCPELAIWPPEEADAVELEGFYTKLQEHGFTYGDTFRGLTRAWYRGQSAFGHIVLPDSAATHVAGYGIHPALLDAALHPLLLGLDGASTDDGIFLPFEWSGITLYATGARELRVRVDMEMGAGGEEAVLSLWAADMQGELVARVERLVARRAGAAQVRQAVRRVARHLYRVDWEPVKAMERGWDVTSQLVCGGNGALADALELEHVPHIETWLESWSEERTTPKRIIVDATAQLPHEDTLSWVPRETQRALLMLQSLLDAPQLEGTEIVWLTRGAVAASPSDRVVGLVRAPIWGLMRSARTERINRVLRTIDVLAPTAQLASLKAAMTQSQESELAVRGESVMAARLGAARLDVDRGPASIQVNRDGTVLITGGTGGLGQAVSKHLIREHGIRRLVLTSRRGLEAEGAQSLVDALMQLGAEEVRVVACDVTNIESLRGVLDSIDGAHPLTCVFHLAGVLDDGVLSSMNAVRLGRVLAPKVNGAWNLHELTRELELDGMVFFSSAAGSLGAPGQANYSAANAFLDSLAHYRCSLGLPSKSLAWGMWESTGMGMAEGLGRAELARMSRQGIVAISIDEGLGLLDSVLSRPEPVLVPVHFDLTKIQSMAEDAGEVPSMWRGLLKPRLRKVSVVSQNATLLRTKLVGLNSNERHDVLVTMLRTEVAAVLGLTSESDLALDESLGDMGLDSLMAVELRNRIAAFTGISIAVSVAFEYPTLNAMAGYLSESLPTGDALLSEMHDEASPEVAGTPEQAASLEGPLWIHYLKTHLTPAFERPELVLGVFGTCGQSRYYEERLTLADQPPAMRAPVRLTQGPSPAIHLVPAFPPTGSLQYAQLLAHLEGTRETYCLRHPGFEPNERLLSWNELIDAHVETLREGGDDSLILMGHSAGGWVSIAIAKALEALQPERQVRVVLLDSLPPSATIGWYEYTGFFDAMKNQMLEGRFTDIAEQSEREAGVLVLADAPHAWSAMGWYNKQGFQFLPPMLDTPTLLLKAAKATPSLNVEHIPETVNEDLGWKRYLSNLTCVQVEGDHFGIVHDPNAEGLVAALEAWLETQDFGSD